MLYVSKYFGAGGYIVVDTDDGAEETVTFGYLQMLASNVPDLCIEGVHKSGKNISLITPYQEPSSMSREQLKLQLLHRVDLVVYKSTITGIVWNNDGLIGRPRIRLSDFGDSCGEFILCCNTEVDDTRLELVLDDKITFTETSFRPHKYHSFSENMQDTGVVFDLREVHDDARAGTVYMQLATGRVDDMFDYIIDSESRKKKMKKRMPGWWC